MAAHGGPVLVVQDTVFFSYGQHPKTRGLGPIGKCSGAGEHGLIMHNALAFTTSGVPWGSLSQSIWARREIPQEEYQEKIERLQCTAIEEKESSKWLLALHETSARTRGRQGHHGGRSGIGLLRVSHASRRSIARSFSSARVPIGKLVPEDSEGCEQHARGDRVAPRCSAAMTVEIPGNGRRKARTASVEVRVAQVTIKPP